VITTWGSTTSSDAGKVLQVSAAGVPTWTSITTGGVTDVQVTDETGTNSVVTSGVATVNLTTRTAKEWSTTQSSQAVQFGIKNANQNNNNNTTLYTTTGTFSSSGSGSHASLTTYQQVADDARLSLSAVSYQLFNSSTIDTSGDHGVHLVISRYGGWINQPGLTFSGYTADADTIAGYYNNDHLIVNKRYVDAKVAAVAPATNKLTGTITFAAGVATATYTSASLTDKNFIWQLYDATGNDVLMDVTRNVGSVTFTRATTTSAATYNLVIIY